MGDGRWEILLLCRNKFKENSAKIVNKHPNENCIERERGNTHTLLE
jgi:hypothetical protein